MSRASRITIALEELKADGIIRAYAQLDRRWMLLFTDGGDRSEVYYTSNEAEAFIAGAQASRE